MAAIGVIGRLGDASSVPTLLELAVIDDADVAEYLVESGVVDELPMLADGDQEEIDAAEAGEETVTADAMQASGQHVDEEATDELAAGERHHLGAFRSVPPLPPFGVPGVTLSTLTSKSA